MRQNDELDPKVAEVRQYLKQGFPDSEITEQSSQENTTGFDYGAYTFKVDTGKKTHLLRVSDEYLSDTRARCIFRQMQQRQIAESMKTVVGPVGFVLLDKRHAKIKRKLPKHDNRITKALEAFGMQRFGERHSIGTRVEYIFGERHFNVFEDRKFSECLSSYIEACKYLENEETLNVSQEEGEGFSKNPLLPISEEEIDSGLDLNCPAFFQLFRDQDFTLLEDSLGKSRWNFGRAYFLAGQYDRIEGCPQWADLENTPIEMPGVSEFQPLKWGEVINACKTFSEVGMHGNHPSMMELYVRTARICSSLKRRSDTLPTIRLTGEQGSGKELLAKAICRLSDRKDFKTVDCSQLRRETAHSELFGHERGSFTGAESERKGLLDVEEGSAVFLDEIGKLDEDVQKMLLRLLEYGELRRFGSDEVRKLRDVLFVSASREDDKSLLPDLGERLAGVKMSIPPLKERLEDVPLLVNHFLQECGPNPVDEYRWPVAFWCTDQVRSYRLSVRELRNMVRDLVLRFEPLQPLGNLRMTQKRKDRLESLEEVVRKTVEKGEKLESKTALAKAAGVPRDVLYDSAIRPIVNRWTSEGKFKRKSKS